MSILDRDALEQSPLADLHAIASELSIDSFRRLRKAELIEAILARQGGEGERAAGQDEAGEEATGDDESPSRRRRWRRGARGRADGEEGDTGDQDSAALSEPAGPEPSRAEAEGPKEIEKEVDRAEPQESSGRREEAAKPGSEPVEGVVELLPGGSGFLRLNPPDPSDDDVYISSAQIKRCELVTGDRVSGPRRPPRRSERFASLLRVDTVNGQPASELADSVRFEDRPVVFPSQRLVGPGGDELLEAIDRAAPLGRGSRATIFGPAAAGKTEVLRRLSAALSGHEELQLWIVLTGVRPEEVSEWQQGQPAPAVSLSFAASSDAQSQALEGVVEQVRRLVARGAHAVLLIDALDSITPSVARKAMASARSVVDGGSLTVIAAAPAPLGGETTVIALDPSSARSGAPAVDESRSWTIRRQLLG